MRYILFALAVQLIFLAGCSTSPKDDIGKYDYLTDMESYYNDSGTIEQPDADTDSGKTWQVTFSFYGIINSAEATAKELKYGDGRLNYRLPDGTDVLYAGQLWAIKKYTNNSSGKPIALIQVYFTQSSIDGNLSVFLLQIEESSMAKKEVFYVNRDKLYKTSMVRVSGAFTDVCFEEEPTNGIVTLNTNSVRVGEPLSLEGQADMKAIDPIDCKKLQP